MDKYIFKGLETFQLIEDMAYRSSSEDLEVYRLTGMAKELEEQGNYKEAIELYSKAMVLIKNCSLKLNSATEKVNKILKENGELEEFEVEE